MSKKSFYCWYLGFTNAYGLQSNNRIFELVQYILKHQSEKGFSNVDVKNGTVSPAKVTLQLSENTLTIVDAKFSSQKHSSSKGRESASSAYKCYLLNYENITHVTRLTIPYYSDIVTCIVRSNLDNDPTKLVLNLHAFRFDSDSTAVKMEQYLNFFRTNYWKKYEKQQLKLQKEQAFRTSNKKQNSRPVSPSENEHLLNGKLRNSFLKRQNQVQDLRIPDQPRNKLPDNSSIGDDRTRSSSSHDHSLGSPRSPNESFSTPFIQHDQQYYSASPTPQYSVEKSNDEQKNYFTKSFNTNNDIKRQGSTYEKTRQVDDVNKEFQQKIKENKILLYPPKDYSASDRERGNFLKANITDFRYSLNEHIVGKEAVKIREKKIYSALAKQGENDSGSDLSLYREEAEKALRILDEAVEGVSLNPVDASSNLFKFKLEDTLNSSRENLTNETNSKMHKKYSNSTENIYAASGSSKQNYNNNNNSFLHNKSTSVASGLNLNLNEPFYDLNKDLAYVKKNPLQMIEEENQNQSNNYKYSLNPTIDIDHQSNKNQDMKNLKYAKVVNEKKQKKASFNNKSTKSTSSETSAANIGFRNGFYPRLQGYQPQWMSSASIQQQDYQQQQQPQQHRVSSFRVQSSNEEKNYNSNKNNPSPSKLKYSESARANLQSPRDKVKSTQDLSTQSSNYNNQKFNNNNPIYETNNFNNNYLNTDNSQFILKPANSIISNNQNFKNQILIQDQNYASNMNRNKSLAGTYISVVPSTPADKSNKKTMNNYNQMNDYDGRQSGFKSDPNLANKYVYHDVYY